MDENNFVRRLKHLYSKDSSDGNCFGEIDFLICVISENKEIQINKSTAVMQWILGFYVPNTVIVLGNEFIYFLTSESYLHDLKSSVDKVWHLIEQQLGVHIHYLKADDSQEHESVCKQLINIMENKMVHGKVGLFHGENYNSNFATTFYATLNSSNFTLINMSAYVAHKMSLKDKEEIERIKRASVLSTSFYYRFFRYFDILKMKNNYKHPLRNIDFAVLLGSSILEEQCPSKKKFGYSHFPIIQSGGFYNLNLLSGSNKNDFKDDIIIISFGIKYQSYCSVMIRTIMIFPAGNQTVEENYCVLKNAHSVIIDTLRDGVALNLVYLETINFIKSKKPELLRYLIDSFGSAIGLEIEEKYISIKQDTDVIAKAKMVFNINIGFESIVGFDGIVNNNDTYSLWIGDTVIVELDSPASILTSAPVSIDKVMRREERVL